MLKTKSKFKLLLVLGIILLAMLLLGTTKVNATSSILSNIPDSIKISIPSTNWKIPKWDTQGDELDKEILETIKSYITEDISNYQIDYNFVETSNGHLLDISQIKIILQRNSEIVESKIISIEYSDNNKRNDTDKNDVKNIVSNIIIENATDINFEYEFCTDPNKNDEILDTQLKNFFANKGLGVISVANGAGEDTPYGSYRGHRVLITKNNVAYYVSGCAIYGTMTITVPASIEDTDKAIMDYSIQKIKERMKNYALVHNYELDESALNSITLTKGAEKDKYIVSCNFSDEGTITIKKAKQEVVTETDRTTNIKLDTNTNIVPANTILNAKEIKEEKTLNIVKESLKELSNKYTTYDITLTSNGVKVQPNGKVKISIPIPTDYDKTKLAVYRVADNGEKTKYDVKVEENYATFETNHFSTYVLAENNVTIADTDTNNNTEKDNTPKTGKLDIINYVLVVTALAGIGIIVFKKHSK